MASWMIHFRVADAIKDSIKNIDMEKFIVGNIAPDCGELNEDGKTFSPLKYITHWENPKNKKESLKDEFFFLYLADSEISSGHKSFYLGYYIHLLTDILWKKKIYYPTKEKYINKFDDEDILNSKIKADWAVIDHMFLRDNDFATFKIFSRIRSFSNIYFNYYSEKAIENKIIKISDYYTNFSGSLHSKYQFLNKEQADDFVVQAVAEIKEELTMKGII